MTHWTQEEKIARFWDLCKDCAENIYGTKPPNPAYALTTAKMLFATTAQESGFDWNRQGGKVPWDKVDIGAASLCQIEKGSIQESIKYLRKRPDVADRVTQWLFADNRASSVWIDKLSPEIILWAMMMDDNHKLALAFCRIHYLRVTEKPIPPSVTEQAEYWMKWYNGGGVLKHMSREKAIAQFVRNFNTHAKGLVEGTE
jgi:hypothetical protein